MRAQLRNNYRLWNGVIATLWLAVFSNYSLKGQVMLEGMVKDAVNGEPVSFCAIGIKNSGAGCLSNEDGHFRIQVSDTADTLVLNNLAYYKKLISVAQLARQPEVRLKPKENQLSEVVVTGNSDGLYKIMEQCRKQLAASKSRESKAYFVLRSYSGGQPVELLEFYFNARHSAHSVQKLGFKNGRLGMAPFKGRYFANYNTSKAITFLSLIDNNGDFPMNPFYLKGRLLKRHYQITLLGINDSARPVYHLAFKPIKNNSESFGGEVWIEKNSGHLLKLILTIDSTQKHPFLPLFPNVQITDVSMQIVKVFEQDQPLQARHLNFSYKVNYIRQDSLRTVNSKGTLYFYDYGKPFVLPYFNFNEDFGDYRNITSLSYNDRFWNNSIGLLYSDKIKKEMQYFKTQGQLINYRNGGNQRKGLLNSELFEYSNLLWSEKKRLSLKKNIVNRDTLAARLKQGAFRYQLYRFKAQIFLDVNEYSDGIDHYSVSIFDVFNSYYHLPEEPYTNCILNIYFDLVEVERRRMEEEIKKGNKSLATIEKAYKAASERILKLEEYFFESVDRGRNRDAVNKWNNMVISELGINNLDWCAPAKK